MIVKAVRNGLGLIILVIDKLTRPKPMQRTAEHQQKVNSAVSGFSLYQLNACPFCIKTRRAMHKLNVDVELRDIAKQKQFRHELQEEGGRVKVPCLRIKEDGGDRWLYESNDIIDFLQKTVA